MDGIFQNNVDDYGIFILITALYILADIPPPAYYDCALWRIPLEVHLVGEKQRSRVGIKLFGEGNTEDSNAIVLLLSLTFTTN